MKRIIAASLCLMMATAFLAPGAAAQATLDPVAQSKSTTSTTTGKSAPKNSPERSSKSERSSESSKAKSPEKSSTKATGTSASQSTTETSEPTSSSARKPARRDIIPIPVLDDGEFDADYAVQVSYVHIPTGFRADSENEEEIRTCLSNCKIFIADHVFREGTEDHRDMATEMLRTSDDGITTRLYWAYPDSMNEVAERYDLEHTTGAATWGKSTTTMHDVATFLAAKVEKGDFDDPVLAALADAAPTGADGYAQDFGTDVLPGVIGTKWGWADERDTMNASASYGEDFVVALNVIGDADTTTEVAEELFTRAPRGELVIEDGELVAKAAGHRQTAAARDDSRATAGDWIAGALLVVTAAGIVWSLRGRNH